jgi:hypothetical protein
MAILESGQPATPQMPEWHFAMPGVDDLDGGQLFIGIIHSEKRG